MKVSILERLLIMGLIPEKSDYRTLKDSIDLKKELSFNEEELRKYDIKDVVLPDGKRQVSFNIEVAAGYEKEIKLKKYIADYLVNKLKEIDKSKELSEQLVTLYEKIVL